jgi:phospholipid/cholesterol/gamma-HCH transport system substrate-binding protein
MEPKREQALVGLFVLIAGAMLIATVFAMSGVFGRTIRTYHAYFAFAGGVEPGTAVRYAGGPKVGHVDSVRLDAQDSSRLDITFSVQSDLPIKTDSRVKIMSMSPLGDNHLEIMPGSAQAPIASNGSLLPSENYLDFNALVTQINDIAPQAQELLHSLNGRATELKETIVRVNDLLSAQNRANLSATLSNTRGMIEETRGMIEENRPQVKATLQRVNVVSERLGPLLENFNKTADEAKLTLNHIDSMIGENRADIRQAVMELRRALTNVTEVTARLDQTLDVNSDRIDEILVNMQRITENLKDFTATIKTQPSSLIRGTSSRDHKPGEQP